MAALNINFLDQRVFWSRFAPDQTQMLIRQFLLVWSQRYEIVVLLGFELRFRIKIFTRILILIFPLYHTAIPAINSFG